MRMQLIVGERVGKLAHADVRSLRKVHPSANYHFRLTQRPVGGGLKRGFDIIFSTAALLVLAPLLLGIALLVRLESPGPALFRQRRAGFRGRAFNILKFRTMRVMENGVVRQATRDDDRITRLGRLLRRTSVDELPQLLNVLAGDMSVVGPRPHATSHDEAFYNINGRYPHRFLARPGITGAAQVAGFRGETETPDKVEGRLAEDFAYIDNWSFWADLRIIAATFRAVTRGANAY
jgi:lipopolysaccharide/colanic/teichoic acid biosynthesis glycosyltransferase